MPTATIDTEETDSGYISFDSVTYTGHENADALVRLETVDVAIVEKSSAFLDFDTRDSITGIPLSAVITKIELIHGTMTATGTGGYPAGLEICYYIGQDKIQSNLSSTDQGVLGALFTGTSGWEEVACLETAPSLGDIIEIPQHLFHNFNRSGRTSLKIQDESGYADDGSYSVLYRILSKTKFTMRISWQPAKIINSAFLSNCSIGA